MPSLLKAKGLYTYRNELQVPEGSLEIASNVVIDEDGVITSRRGFGQYATAPVGVNQERGIHQLLTYKSRLLRHYNDVLEFDAGGGSFAAFSGVFSEIEPGLRIKGTEVNGNYYFTTADGIKKISAKSASDFTTNAGFITDSGAPKALDIFGASNIVTSGGYLEPEKDVYYKLVWGYVDNNDVLVLGAPSSQFSVSNIETVNQVNVQLVFPIPAGVSVAKSYFYQIYRTPQVDKGDDPGTEYGLVKEEFVTAAEVAAGVVTSFIDDYPETYRDLGTPLYTNLNSGQGATQANYNPPVAKDLAYFRNSMFYANTKTNHQVEFQLLSSDDLHNKKFYIRNTTGTVVQTYTFKQYDPNTTVNPTDLSTGLTGIVGAAVYDDASSIALAFATTAQNLVAAINYDKRSKFVNAYHPAGDGYIILENKELSDDKFYIAVSIGIGSEFDPSLPEWSGTGAFPLTKPSSNQEAPNRLYFSKISQPEAVPIVNYLDIGPKDKAIQRIIALQDNLVVLKEDGVYLVTGSSAPNFGARLLDRSAVLLAPDSADVLNNRIYCLTTQGIVAISESGVSIVSREIEDRISSVVNSRHNYKYVTFGVAYENDRSYHIWLPSSPSDEAATQAYRYNIFTSSWTRWNKENTCGIINPADDKMYLGSWLYDDVEQERKNGDRTDFADRTYSANFILGGLSDGYIRMTNVAELSKGDVLYQEQYLTTSTVNRLIRQLDYDPNLSISLAAGGAGVQQYVSLAVAGDDLAEKCTAIQDMINNYAPILLNPLIFTYSTTDPLVLQQGFNLLIDVLNGEVIYGLYAVDMFYHNYQHSVGTTYYETVVSNINIATSTVTVTKKVPFIYINSGELTAYQGITCEVAWTPQHFGAPEKLKQISEGTFIFDQNNFYSAEVAFKSDLSQSYESIEFQGRGPGIWGMDTWGGFIWGGEGADVPLRTFIPSEKQKCRYLTCKFKHINARERFKLLGISLEVRVISSKGYK